MKHPVLLAIPLLVVSVSLAAADVYKCPDASGRMVYRNHPCGEAAPVLESSPQAIPPPARLAPPAPLPAAPLPPVATIPPPPPPVPASTSKPVDQNQFYFITHGMREAEVRRRLGPPGLVEEIAPLLRRIGRDFIQVRRTIWVYPGDGYAMTRFFLFENGVMVDKGDRH